jgi:hypothetical protein
VVHSCASRLVLFRQAKKSESRYVVAFIKLFIPDGFILDDGSNGYKDDVLAVGTRAEEAVLQFRCNGSTRKEPAAYCVRCARFTSPAPWTDASSHTSTCSPSVASGIHHLQTAKTLSP